MMWEGNLKTGAIFTCGVVLVTAEIGGVTVGREA
jgi:hypothetical protein